MTMTRRAALTGGLSLFALPTVLTTGLRAATAEASRRFDIVRGGAVIGHHATVVRRAGEVLTVETDIGIVVRLLGIPVYRYALASRETWEGGRLMTLDSEGDDDGDLSTARVRREGAALVASGSWSGALPDDAATTTYWTPTFLERPVWISTQTGAPLEVDPRRVGTETLPTPLGPIEAARWRSEGDLPVTMFYDTRGEWVGNAFDAGGEEARFRLVAETGPMTPLWNGA